MPQHKLSFIDYQVPFFYADVYDALKGKDPYLRRHLLLQTLSFYNLEEPEYFPFPWLNGKEGCQIVSALSEEIPLDCPTAEAIAKVYDSTCEFNPCKRYAVKVRVMEEWGKRICDAE